MIKLNNYRFLILLSLIVGLASCVSLKKQTVNVLTIYNLDEASSIEIELNNPIVNYAKINTKLNDGTIVKGDILLTDTPTPVVHMNYPPAYHSKLNSATNKIQQLDSTFIEKNYRSMKSFPELFGFSKNSNISPKGSATLLVGVGKSIQIIFYQVDYKKQFASGIGYDNEGNLYRIYLTTEIY
jgi:hypothetical protein